MKLTKIERLILHNQFDILSKIGTDGEYYESMMEILSSGYEYEYQRLFGAIHDDGVPAEVCIETIHILNMFRRFGNALAKLSENQISELGDGLKKLEFQGFDENNDKHYYYTKFMIDKQNKWAEQKNKYLNSHDSYTIEIYRKMLQEYNSSELKPNDEITFDDLKSFLSKI